MATEKGLGLCKLMVMQYGRTIDYRCEIGVIRGLTQGGDLIEYTLRMHQIDPPHICLAVDDVDFEKHVCHAKTQNEWTELLLSLGRVFLPWQGQLGWQKAHLNDLVQTTFEGKYAETLKSRVISEREVFDQRFGFLFD